MIYVFGDYALDIQRYELRHGGIPCPLEPQAFNVLAYLIQHRDRVVTKQELLECLWSGQYVGEATLIQRVVAVRKAIGDSGRAQRLIKTVHGRGYRFIARVEEHLGDAARHDENSVELDMPAVPMPSTPRSPLEGERKLVTVLCAALGDGPDADERLALDGLYNQIRVLYDLTQGVVQRYEGTVQPVADAHILVVFGAPMAQEDHAWRAVLAAVELQQHAAAHEPCLPVRMGVHTGLVAVGGLGDAQEAAMMLVGDTARVAVALQEHAGSGTLLCSEDTARLVQDLVPCEAVPAVQITRQSTPLSVYEIAHVNVWQTPVMRSRPRVWSRFAGRRQELAILNELLAQVAAGRGQVVGVVGEPGMGKSRLLHEFRQRLGGKSVTYVEGHCLSYGAATPYLPVLDTLRRLCDITDRDAPAVIAVKVHRRLRHAGMEAATWTPYLLHLLGVSADAPSLARLTPEAIRERTFEALRQVHLQYSRQQPLIVAIENLHWIDPTSEAWLTSLVEQLAGAPCLLLGTYRPGYRPPWMDKSYMMQLTLHQLTRQESLAVVQSVLQTDRLPEPLVQEILTKAAGNPLFLEELARNIREHGMQATSLSVPGSIQTVLAARIDRLPPEEKRLLQTAAVIGMEVLLPLLQAVAEVPVEALHRGLGHLQATEFLYETRVIPDRVYTFKHALTREVTYQSLLLRTRQQIHQCIARALESRFPETTEAQPELLAHHATEAGLHAQAVGYWRRAGLRASDRSAHHEAVDCFERGLEALEHLPESRGTIEQSIDIHLELRRARHELGDLERLLDNLLEAERLAKFLNDACRQGWTVCYLANYFYRTGVYDRQLTASQRAVSLAADCGDVALQIASQFSLGLAYWGLCEYRQAITLNRQLLTSCDGEKRTELFGLAGFASVLSRMVLAWSLAEQGLFEEAIAFGEEGVQIAETAEHPGSLVRIYWSAGHAYLLQGDLERALPSLKRGLHICQETGNVIQLALNMAQLGYGHVLLGRIEEGLNFLEQAAKQASAFNRMRYYRSLLVAWLSEAYLLAEQSGEASAWAQNALALARECKERGNEAWVLRLLGNIASQHNPPEVESAETHYRQALALAEALGMRPLQAHCHCGLGALYGQIGEAEQARAELSTAIDMYRGMEMTFWLPQAETELAAVNQS